MESRPAELMLAVQDLRKGLFVHLDLGWTEHPFPLNRFKITSSSQIDQMEALGLRQVRVLTGLSDADVIDELLRPQTGASGLAELPVPQLTPEEAHVMAVAVARRRQVAEQHAALLRCERQFGEAASAWKQIDSLTESDPQAAHQVACQAVRGFVGQIGAAHESHIRLLSETATDSASLHAVNVTVLSLLLGLSMRVDAQCLEDIGVGALLHDIGKRALPDRLRWYTSKFTPVESRAYREHVEMGLGLARNMGLSPGALSVLAQHHETADGRGYPRGLKLADMSPAARIVALVDAYDAMCNPGVGGVAAVTPHEALATLFAQLKPRYDPHCLTAFIRMMGVYPPGSVVQLNDDRYAEVVSVNATRPLRPRVVVYDASIPREEALILDLQSLPNLSIRRSLHPWHLPAPVLSYLSPRKRMCYFFECVTDREDLQAANSSAAPLSTRAAA